MDLLRNSKSISEEKEYVNRRLVKWLPKFITTNS